MRLPGVRHASANDMNAFDRRTAERDWRREHSESAQRVTSTRALVFLACAAVGACASNADSVKKAVWHEGKVLSVVTIQRLHGAVPVCGLPFRDVTPRPDSRVAVVRSRVGKSSYDEAFFLPAGDDLREGGDVRFKRVGCTVQQRPAPESSLKS